MILKFVFMLLIEKMLTCKLFYLHLSGLTNMNINIKFLYIFNFINLMKLKVQNMFLNN